MALAVRCKRTDLTQEAARSDAEETALGCGQRARLPLNTTHSLDLYTEQPRPFLWGPRLEEFGVVGQPEPGSAVENQPQLAGRMWKDRSLKPHPSSGELRSERGLGHSLFQTPGLDLQLAAAPQGVDIVTEQPDATAGGLIGEVEFEAVIDEHLRERPAGDRSARRHGLQLCGAALPAGRRPEDASQRLSGESAAQLPPVSIAQKALYRDLPNSLASLLLHPVAVSRFQLGLRPSKTHQRSPHYAGQQMLSLLLACADPPQSGPAQWSTPEDCAALPASGKRDVCYSEVLPRIFCADPARGATLLSAVEDPTFRDAVLTRVTRDHFPTTDAYCAQITSPPRQERCRQLVIRARLQEHAIDPACATPPMVEPPRADWCDCSGPDTTLRLFQPQLSGETTATLPDLLGAVPAALARCHQQEIYPSCPCFTADAAVVFSVTGGTVGAAHIEGALPAAAADCMAQSADGHTFSELTGTVRLPLKIRP